MTYYKALILKELRSSICFLGSVATVVHNQSERISKSGQVKPKLHIIRVIKRKINWQECNNTATTDAIIEEHAQEHFIEMEKNGVLTLKTE
ncbi:MAG: hypothetical protein FMJ08_09165 [Halomonas sp.]|nr:hypothetical protein [Halomonas sp.]TVM05456.1 MAG: hypothetical protein FMJ08_09165 [Halomonas sp.]